MPDRSRSAMPARSLALALAFLAAATAAAGLGRSAAADGKQAGPEAGAGCTLPYPPAPDCNGNDTPDLCDIRGGESSDCNSDAVPDECQAAACDLNDGVIMISVGGPDEISWQPERRYSSFNLYRGRLPRFDGNGTMTAQAHPEKPDRFSGRECHRTAVSVKDGLVPDPGEAIYYFVTGNRLGAEHRASIDDGAGRTNPGPCPAPARHLDVSVRTGRASYGPAETVRIEVFLANLNPAVDLDLLFPTRCRVTFRIEDLTGGSVYLDLSHRSCPYEDNRLTLRPGQIAAYEFAWDQTDDRGRPVARAAEYVVRGMVLYRDPVPDGITGIALRP